MAQPTGVDFVNLVRRYIGTPYVWGGESPSGFDCSGLVDYGLTRLGVKGVPRTSEDQYAWSKRLKYTQLKAGDLIFLNFPGEQSPGHVMIYAGDNKAIQAPSSGQLVQVSHFTPAPAGSSWGGTGVVVGYGRVPGLSYRGEQTTGKIPVTSVPTTGVGGNGAIYKQPPRPGSQPEPGADYAGIFGIPGAPDAPGGDLNPLNNPFGLPVGEGALHTLWDGLSSAGDTLGAVTEGVKWLMWLLRPKHWAMIGEVLVGAVLVGLGIYWIGGGDTPDVPMPLGLAALGQGLSRKRLNRGASE